jgi:hypothetical protein
VVEGGHVSRSVLNLDMFPPLRSKTKLPVFFDAGEKSYHDCYQAVMFSNNPYRFRVISPYGYNSFSYGIQRPDPRAYSASVQQTIQLNNALNAEAQAQINAKEPQYNIWEIDDLNLSMSNMTIEPASSTSEDKAKSSMEKATEEKPLAEKLLAEKSSAEKSSIEETQSISTIPTETNGESSKPPKRSKFAGFKKALSIKSPEEKAVIKSEKMKARGRELRNAILAEENGRWPDDEWKRIVAEYQEKVGMTRKIAHLRIHYPLQYLHLLRAGYFEPIPVAWATLASNPLKFSIEAASGWRGITPTWRGYEDTAEERLYWVLNHRAGSAGTRMKPDLISAMNMARARMASAVPPPPAYFSADDTCHVQHTSEGYSKQVMPPAFAAFDRPELATDDTMILLDVSGSMDFEPVRPNYVEYLITGYSRSTQPKNKGKPRALVVLYDLLTFVSCRCSQGYRPALY